MMVGWKVSGGLLVVVLLSAAPVWAAEPAQAMKTAQVQVELEPGNVALVSQLPQPNLGHDATTLQRQGYDWLCGGKCELKLAPGRHSFALTQDNATVTPPSSLDVPVGRSVLRGRYDEGSTVLPWTIIGTSPVTWYASLMVMKAANDGDAVSGGQLALGTGLALTQLVVGIVLLTKTHDTATFTLVPAAPAPVGARLGFERAAWRDQPQGISAQWAF